MSRRGPQQPVAVPAGGGLRYATDAEPGILRRRSGRSFRYLDADGDPIRDPSTLARIRSLAIPPAWQDVWICHDNLGHLQASGRDARGRKQPRYHAAWRNQQDELKFSRLPAFGRALPRIRRRVKHDLAGPGLTKNKILATVVALLEATALRVGNAEYARDNRSFGLTTLRNRHVTVTGTVLRFRFPGKGGKAQVVGMHDRRLASIVTRCGSLPGQDLFQYLDAHDEPQPVGSADVNAYLREAAGIEITAKDFRTWIGTLIAFHELRVRPDRTRAGLRTGAGVKRSLEAVATVLGNTPAVSRQSYVAPVIVESYRDGLLPPRRPRVARRLERGPVVLGRREELALVHFLEQARPIGQPPMAGPANDSPS